jgi:hypothetical protein
MTACEALMLKSRYLIDVSDQFQASAALPRRKEVPIRYWMGSWVGPRVRLDAFEKNLLPHRESNQDCLIIRPVAYSGPDSF